MSDSILRLGDLTVTPVVSDVTLAQAYIKMLEEGTLDTVFYQGRPSLQDFLAEYLTAGRRITLGCFRGTEFCGLGWVYGCVTMGNFKRAETGMWFSRRQSSNFDNVTFGKMMLQLFFTHYQIDALFGTTPEPNKLALRYARKIGMELIGPVPNYCIWNGALSPGWLSHISRDQWLERNRPAAKDATN